MQHKDALGKFQNPARVSSSHLFIEKSTWEMSTVKLDELLSKETAQRIVSIVINGIEKKQLSQFLVTDSDFDFFMPCLQAAIASGKGKKVIKIYKKILVSPSSDDALIRDVGTYNKYVRRVLKEIPAALNSEDTANHDSSMDLLQGVMVPDGHENFDKETWGAVLECLLECVRRYRGKESKNPLSLFVEQFPQASLEMEKAKLLMENFAERCFQEERGNGQDLWDKLFRKLFEYLLSPMDDARREFIVGVFAKMKQVGKEYDDSPQSVSGRSFCVSFFKLAMQVLKTWIRANSTLFKEPIPADHILRLFADGIFLSSSVLAKFKAEADIFGHMEDVFKVFTKGVLGRSSPWHQVFVRYIGSLLMDPSAVTTSRTPAILFSVLNSAAGYAAQLPELMWEMVWWLIPVSCRFPTDELGKLEAKQLLWPNLFANLLEIARAKGNETVVSNLCRVIHKFVYADSCNDHQACHFVHTLMLTVLSGDEELLAAEVQKLEDRFTTPYKQDKGKSAYFGLLVLAMVPYYLPRFGESFARLGTFKKLSKKLFNNLINDYYIDAFILSLIEISGQSRYFVQHREGANELFKGLKSMKSKMPTLAESALMCVRYKLFPVQQCRAFEATFTDIRAFVLHGMIVRICERPDSHKVGITIRTLAGTSMLEVESDLGSEKEPPSEANLQPPILHRSDIDIDSQEYPPFCPLTLKSTVPERSKGLSLLSALGLASSDMSIQFVELPRSPELLKEIDELDDMSYVDYHIRVSSVTRQSTSIDEVMDTQQFALFKADLGPCFEMSICRFFFSTERGEDILIVFNESNLGINAKQIGPAYELVISVSPVDLADGDVTMYNVTIVRASKSWLMLPLAREAPLIVRRESLARTLGSLVFWQKGHYMAAQSGSECRCSVVERCDEHWKQRKERLEQIISKYGRVCDLVTSEE